MAARNARTEARLEFRILGPVAVLADGQPVAVGAGKERALLALLLIHRREAVSADRLIDELWGGRSPATAAKAVQVYVSRLRKAIGADALVTRGGGYALEIDPNQVDADRFDALASRGRRALEEGDHQRAATTLRDALALWRGAPLADFAYESFAQSEIGRLEQARVAALEDRVEADLALGRHAELIGELEPLADEHPERERLQRQLMLALYRSGRQTEALERYTELRRRLVDELGIEPGAELRALQAAILAQDPSLEAPRRPSLVERATAGSRLGTGALLIVAGGLVLLAAAITAAVVSSGGDEPPDVNPNSVAVIDPEGGEVVADVAVGARPSAISAGEGGIWVANFDDDSISQIDPDSRIVESTTALSTRVDGLGTGAGGVWAVDLRRELLVEISPVFRSVVRRVDIRTAGRKLPSAIVIGRTSAPVAAEERSVWVGNGSAAVLRVSPNVGEVRGRTDVGNDPHAIAVSDSGVWVADAEDNSVTRIEPSSGAVAQTVPAGQGAGAIAVGEGGVWVANARDNTVTRIDPSSGSAVTTIAVGEHPTGITTGAGSVWVANSGAGTVSRIDPDSNDVVETIATGQAPEALVFADDMLWVAVQEAADTGPPASGGGGSDSALRIAATEDPGPGDPALGFGDAQLLYATCAGLFNYPDAAAPEGAHLVPEVSDGPPSVSGGGRTYSFTIRPGFRFSPPSNEPVTAEAFERAIERALDPRVNSYAGRLILNIVGAAEFAAGRANSVKGVRASGDTLEIRLSRPAPEFLAALATPWFCAVPPETPVEQKGVPVVPSAGPYYVETYDPGKRLVLLRNPNYPGQRPNEFAEIDYEIGVSPRAAASGVESGRFDYTAAIPPEEEARVEERYGSGSEAASAGRQQYFVESGPPGLLYLAFNTTRPPFDDARLRQAVNFAIDRAALAATGALNSGRPTDQYIPPGFPGFADEAIYPLGGPDVERARELAGDVERRATLYTCSDPECAEAGEIVRANLAAIGIDVDVKRFPVPTLFEHLVTPGEPFDLAQFGWGADEADPATFINSVFHSRQVPYAYFDDPRFNRRMAQAARSSGPERYRAYARLDRDLASVAAPAVAYASGTSPNFFSARIGCQVNHPLYGIILGRLCLR